MATLAFDGAHLEEAKVGVLAAAAGASALTWLVFRATALLPWQRRIAALLGDDEPLVDLAYDVEPERDHIRGPLDGPVTVVEYGDFECPYCGRAEPHVRELLRDFADVRYVWRHLPLSDVHANAELAAVASEAAAAQGAFWPMHDLLLEHQDALEPRISGLRRAARARRRALPGATWTSMPAPAASPRTSRAPISAASPAHPPSSSTAAVTTAPTTSAPCRKRCARQAARATLKGWPRLRMAERVGAITAGRHRRRVAQRAASEKLLLGDRGTGSGRARLPAPRLSFQLDDPRRVRRAGSGPARRQFDGRRARRVPRTTSARCSGSSPVPPT